MHIWNKRLSLEDSNAFAGHNHPFTRHNHPFTEHNHVHALNKKQYIPGIYPASTI